MMGLLIKELIIREDMRRCLIVRPGALVEQWQDELKQKFHLNFKMNFKIFSSAHDFLKRIVALSALTNWREKNLQEKLRDVDLYLIIFDKAHKMSAKVWGSDIKYTKRIQLGQLFGKITRHF